MAGVGGARAGSGRKAGTSNVKTREIADKAAAEGITPLEYMLKIMRQEECPNDVEPKAHLAMRFEAAKAAAPFIHPRLSAVEAQVEHAGAIGFKWID